MKRTHIWLGIAALVLGCIMMRCECSRHAHKEAASQSAQPSQSASLQAEAAAKEAALFEGILRAEGELKKIRAEISLVRASDAVNQ